MSFAMQIDTGSRNVTNKGQQYKDWERLYHEDRTNTKAEICVDSLAWSASNYRQYYYLEARSFVAAVHPACLAMLFAVMFGVAS